MFRRKYYILILMVFFFACARKEARFASLERIENVPQVTPITTFKGMAHVVAEKSGVKWANNVVVLVKLPGMVRLDALERISDVVATLAVKDGKGSLVLPLENKTYAIEGGRTILPKVGEVPVTTDKLAEILVGRPTSEGAAKVSDAFTTDKGSYFIRGSNYELEMSSADKMPLVYSEYSSNDKKHLLYEAVFDDFKTVAGKIFPGHIIIRVERPKLFIEFRYKDLQADVKLHDGLFVK